MGRKSKGDRHLVMPSLPREVARRIQTEAKNLGCTPGDFIAFVVCARVGVDFELPLGTVADPVDPRPGPQDRVRYNTKIPRAAANVMIEEATRRGITNGDFVTESVSAHFGIAYTPRVMKKAIKAWEAARSADLNMEQLPMTG